MCLSKTRPARYKEPQINTRAGRRDSIISFSIAALIDGMGVALKPFSLTNKASSPAFIVDSSASISTVIIPARYGHNGAIKAPGFFVFIIPKFSSVYDTLGAELPAYTILLVKLGEWLQGNILFVLIIITTVLTSVWLFILTDRGRLIWDSLLLKIPIFGQLIEQNILSKFSKTFGILVSAGVPVLDTMHLVQKVVENRAFELGLISAANNIENGSNISTALKETQIFPPIMIQLISTGEETGEIDKLSLKASEFYTKQVNAIVDRLTAIIEPTLIILVGLVVGAIIIVTYLPIFQFGAALG